MNLRGLVVATDALLGRANPSARELSNALRVGCRELRALLENKDFVAQLESDVRPSDAAIELCDNLEAFEDFVQEEFDLLLAAGLQRATAQALLGYVHSARPLIALGEPHASDAIVALTRLRDRTCDAAERIELSIGVAEHRRGLRDLLRRTGKVCGGTLLAVVNGGAAGVLGPIGVDLSIGIGGAIIYDGIRGQ